MSDNPHRLPADLRDTDVVAVQVTAPFRVRVIHRDGTSAVHVFKPCDFGTGDFAVLGTAAGFATAQVVEPANLGWVLPSGLIYDLCSDGLWAHARGWCPDGSHDLAEEVEDGDADTERIGRLIQAEAETLAYLDRLGDGDPHEGLKPGTTCPDCGRVIE